MELTLNTTALKERLTRVANGDGWTFAVCTSAYAGLHTLHGFYTNVTSAKTGTSKRSSRREHLRTALMRTRTVLPMVSASVAVGIFTMNATIYAVDTLRQYHSATNPLVALPIAGGLLSASKGLKGMAQGAAVFGLFALGVQSWTRYQQERGERIPLELRLQNDQQEEDCFTQQGFGDEEQVIRI